MKDIKNREIFNICDNIKNLGLLEDSSKEVGISFLKATLSNILSIDDETESLLKNTARQLRINATKSTESKEAGINFAASDSLKELIKYAKDPIKKIILRDAVQTILPELERELESLKTDEFSLSQSSPTPESTSEKEGVAAEDKSWQDRVQTTPRTRTPSSSPESSPDSKGRTN